MNAVTVDVSSIPPQILTTQCRALIGCIKNFYKNPANCEEYEKWYEARHGHKPDKASYIKTE